MRIYRRAPLASFFGFVISLAAATAATISTIIDLGGRVGSDTFAAGINAFRQVRVVG